MLPETVVRRRRRRRKYHERMNEALVPAFHVMAKPTGARCNLRCDYCFFLEKERLYPGSELPHDERGHGGVHRADCAGAARTAGDARLAGRRADADGARLLPPGARGRGGPRARRHGRRAHAADQRRPARRRVVRVPGRERLPRRPQHRRAARAARRVPARPRRAAGLRPASSRPPAACRSTAPRSTCSARSTRPTPATRSRCIASSATSSTPGTSSSSPSSRSRRRPPTASPAPSRSAACSPTTTAAS